MEVLEIHIKLLNFLLRKLEKKNCVNTVNRFKVFCATKNNKILDQ